MTEKAKNIALFRLTVLGPLASRDRLSHGELKTVLHALSSQTYSIPYSNCCRLSEKTIERWYYQWLRGGFDALLPKKRSDQGQTHLDADIQAMIVSWKQDNPARSLNTLIRLLESTGTVARGEISRSTLHRFLQSKQLSKRIVSDANTIERRRFEATHAGEIWHGDVMHGPSLGRRKLYLVSLLDDHTRLITHSEFGWGETALDIERALKQAVLKRGLPNRLIIDNGSAYRANTLQFICAKLGIRLVYCPAYEPQGKGKLERWHRTLRDQFLTELKMTAIQTLDDINSRLWAWLEQVYHVTPHEGLDQSTPIQRWRNDLVHVRPLGAYAKRIDDIFCHRITRQVKKDGTVSWKNHLFEVPYECVGERISLVVDPHTQKPLRVETLSGEPLGAAHPLDKHHNCYRKRQRPKTIPAQTNASNNDHNVVEMARERYEQQRIIPSAPSTKK